MGKIHFIINIKGQATTKKNLLQAKKQIININQNLIKLNHLVIILKI